MSAVAKLMPRPPALVDNKNTKLEESLAGKGGGGRLAKVEKTVK